MTEEQEDATPDPALRERVLAVLASYHGKTTAITEAGKENMRTVNKVSRLTPLRHVSTDKSFRHNITRYEMTALAEDVLIGARREGNGVWSLVAEPAPPRP
jgi:4-aminobutyrate aminotransferase-like enzyme